MINKDDTRIIVRLRRSFWHDARGVYERTELKYLKRHCLLGWNFLEEDCQNIGADEVLPRVINLNECKEGVYQIEMVNQSRDWETGCVDDWDYKLIPFKTE